MDAMAWLFNPSSFPPRWRCGAGWAESPWLGWLHILSDIGIFAAYVSIPVVLLYFASKKTDLPFRGIFLLFAAFILLCGMTHIMEAIIFWWPLYRAAGFLKFITALVSITTVLALIRIAPELLSMRSVAELEREIDARRRAERSLLEAKALLEQRVDERTIELKQMVEALNNERELLHVTLRSIGDGVIVTDQQAKISFLNPVAEQLTGWTQGDAEGKPLVNVFVIVNEETRASVDNPAMRALSEGVIVGLANHTVLINRSGVEHPIDDSAAPIRNHQGDITGAVLIFRDVTKRRNQERQLIESEKQFRQLADSIPLLCWMANPDGHIFWYNERWYDYTGTTLNQMQGWGWQSVHDPAVLPLVLTRWNESIATISPFEMTFPLRGSDGTFRKFLTRAVPIFDNDGKLTRWFGTNTDIDETTRAQEALIESEQRFRLATEAVVGVVYECDLKTGHVLRSSGLKQLTGYSPEEAEPTIAWWSARVTAADIATADDRFKLAVDSNAKYIENEYTIRHRDGSLRVVWDRAVLVRDEHNTVVKLIGSTIDVTDRMRAEREARDARDRLALALSAGGIGTWDWDVQNDRMRPDESFLRIFGIEDASQKDDTLDRFAKRIHPQDQDRVRNAVSRVLHSGGAYEEEYRVVLPDGNERWIVARGRVEKNTGDLPVRFPGVVIDVTEKKLADQQLRFQSDLTKSIMDNATTAIFMMDSQSHCTLVNPAAEKMTGYTLDELRGGPLHSFIHHHRSDGTRFPAEACPLDRALRDRAEVREHHDVFVRKNGEFFPVCCNARVIYKEDVAIGTVIEVRDITIEAKAAQTAKFLVDASEILASVQDLKSTLNQIASHAVSYLCDWCVVDLLDDDREIKRVASAHADQQKEKLVRLLQEQYPVTWDSPSLVVKVLRTGEPQLFGDIPEGLIDSIAVDATHRELIKQLAPRSFMVLPLKIRGKTFGAIGFVRSDSAIPLTPDDLSLATELTRRAATAIDNAKLYENLSDADRRKDEFLATLAHELRNPLAPIRNGLQLMKLAPSPATVEHARSMMERQVLQLVRLVDDLMDVSRISRGKLELRFDTVALSQVINSAVETSRPLIEEFQHTLKVELPSTEVYVRADILRLAQAFLNLLNNAAKYSDPGATISISAVLEGTKVNVSVKDNGIGIEADQLPRIFDLFSQVDRSLEKSRGGLGIGLTLVQRLVSLHGGQITAHSEGAGKGSTFLITLPILETKTPSEEQRLEETSAIPCLKILIVDDNRDSADSLTLMLKIMGHETRTGYDGEEAVKLAAEYSPDVILLDIGLPKLSGYDACRRIRQSIKSNAIIIAQTGWGQAEDRQKTKDAGFDFHMVKPIDTAMLFKLLDGSIKK